MRLLRYLSQSSLATQWIILGISLMTIGIAIASNLYFERNRAEKREQDRLMTQAQVIRAGVEHDLVAVNAVLEDLRRNLPRHVSANDLAQDIATLTDAMPGVRTFLFLDAQGEVVASSRPGLKGRNFAYREYFQTVRQNPDPDMLFVSAPFKTTLGAYGINLARMIPDRAGRFDGIVVATLDPDYFKSVMASVLYAPDMWTAIAHGDGIQFLMVPEREGQTGKNLLQPGSFFSRHRDSGKDASILTGVVYATGEERMMALRTIRPAQLKQDKPLVVAVGRDLATIFEPWRRDVRAEGGLFVLIVLMAVTGLRLFQRWHGEFERQTASAAKALEDSEHFMRVLTDNIPGMVGYWTADLRCGFANSRYLEWFGRTHEQMRGIHIKDLMGEDLFRLNEPHIRAVLRGERQQFERTLTKADGSIGHTLANYIPDREGDRTKGFFVLVSDVTTLKNAEVALERLARTDSLTGLPNRRYFLERAEQELSRSTRYGGPLSILMIDIDHFKAVNDTYGHTTGDLVLQKVAAICRQTLRDIDVVGRLGGEEFAVALPQTDSRQANEVAERLRQCIADTPVSLEHGLPIRVTISIGITTLAGTDTNIDKLLSQADEALYRAKRGGRNQACTFMPADGEATV